MTGEGRYTEDIPAEGALHAAFVRAIAAHARIGHIDSGEARSMPGVVGVFTAADLGLKPIVSPFCHDDFARPPLAIDKVRFLGEAVAVVVAEERAQALDAAATVFVELEPLPAVVDPLAAAGDDAPRLFEAHGDNVAWSRDFGPAEISFDEAEVVVEARFVNQRVLPVPLEPNGALAVPGDDGITLYVPCQAPHQVRSEVAGVVGIDETELRVIAPAVGGGFGAKIPAYPEHMVVTALARRLNRAVRYVESRSENMLAMTHGRAQIQDVRIGATRGGRLVALDLQIHQDGGAYPSDGGLLPQLTAQMASGVYAIPSIRVRARCVATNTTPTGAYRGAGRPEATAMIERAIDMVARELAMDPAEIRRINYIAKDDFPHTTATGAVYDTGDYELPLNEALQLAGYDELRAEQRRRREANDPRLLGIGISSYVEVTGFGPEFGSVEVHEDGTATVLTGVSPHGQGHETSMAQIASGVLGIPLPSIRVVHSDTAVVPRGGGTMGSRSLQKGGSAVFQAGNAVLDKAKRIAAHLLEVSPDDVIPIGDGRLGVAGVPDRTIGWDEIARAAADPGRLPEDVEPGLKAGTDFKPEIDMSYPFGTHVAVVEIDAETGRVRLLRHVAVDDCGRILNPMMVEGQVHGGIAQGAAQALLEQAVYDDDGNLLTGNLATYGFPSAAELPSFETKRTETPTPINPLGAKGIGESATIGSTPAVQNAVVDALSHLGIRHLDMPLTPERVWRAINAS